MKHLMLLAAALFAVILANPTPSQAADGACTASGRFVFYDVATTRAKIPAKAHTTFAALGLRAKLNDCDIAIVCTPAESGEDRYKVAGQRCAAVRQALARYERRPGNRSGIQDSIEKRAPKGLGYPPGSVVVILQ